MHEVHGMRNKRSPRSRWSPYFSIWRLWLPLPQKEKKGVNTYPEQSNRLLRHTYSPVKWSSLEMLWHDRLADKAYSISAVWFRWRVGNEHNYALGQKLYLLFLPVPEPLRGGIQLHVVTVDIVQVDGSSLSKLALLAPETLQWSALSAKKEMLRFRHMTPRETAAAVGPAWLFCSTFHYTAHSNCMSNCLDGFSPASAEPSWCFQGIAAPRESYCNLVSQIPSLHISMCSLLTSAYFSPTIFWDKSQLPYGTCFPPTFHWYIPAHSKINLAYVYSFL